MYLKFIRFDLLTVLPDSVKVIESAGFLIKYVDNNTFEVNQCPVSVLVSFDMIR